VATEPAEINDDEILFRRLAPDHLNPDGTTNSNAYKRRGKPDPEISVDLARLTWESDALVRAGRPGFHLGVLQVRDVRALGLVVRHAPTPENPSHTVIEGNTSKAMCRQLAEITAVRIPPVVPKTNPNPRFD
jgi:hypothetical protein